MEFIQIAVQTAMAPFIQELREIQKNVHTVTADLESVKKMAHEGKTTSVESETKIKTVKI